MILASPWLVLSWYAVFCQSRTRILLLSLSLACCLLAGFTPFFFVIVISTLLLALTAVPRRGLTLDLAAAAALAALLSLAQLGISLERLHESIAKYRTDWIGLGGGISPDAFLTTLLPNYFQTFDEQHFTGHADPTQLYLFLGWSVPGSIAFGIRAIPRWLLALSLLLTVLMFGEWSPVGRLLFSTLPPFFQSATDWYPYRAPFTLAINSRLPLRA